MPPWISPRTTLWRQRSTWLQANTPWPRTSSRSCTRPLARPAHCCACGLRFSGIGATPPGQCRSNPPHTGWKDSTLRRRQPKPPPWQALHRCWTPPVSSNARPPWHAGDGPARPRPRTCSAESSGTPRLRYGRTIRPEPPSFRTSSTNGAGPTRPGARGHGSTGYQRFWAPPTP